MAIRKIIGLTLGLCGVVIGIIIGMETLAGFFNPNFCYGGSPSSTHWINF